jgi:hypothetical protein
VAKGEKRLEKGVNWREINSFENLSGAAFGCDAKSNGIKLHDGGRASQGVIEHQGRITRLSVSAEQVLFWARVR